MTVPPAYQGRDISRCFGAVYHRPLIASASTSPLMCFGISATECLHFVSTTWMAWAAQRIMLWEALG